MTPKHTQNKKEGWEDIIAKAVRDLTASHPLTKSRAREILTSLLHEREGEMVRETPILSVGYHKGEMDFGVNCSICDLSYEQMKELREMTIVMIGQAEQMWGREQEKKSPPSMKSLTK